MTALRGSTGNALRRAARKLLPPIVADAVRGVRGRMPGIRGEWEYQPAGWPESLTGSAGWDHASVAQTHMRGWDALLERAMRPRIVSGTDYAAHNTIMTFAYVFGRAAADRTHVSILDWGCGMGQYAVLARALFPDVPVEFHCRELPHLVERGRRVLPNDTFHAEDSPLLSRRYDLVIASGSLQYIQDWRACLNGLAGVTGRFLFVTRIPILNRASSYVGVQRPHQQGYLTEYPGWFLRRKELVESVEQLGLTLDREFLVDEHALVPGAPEQPEYRGFLFSATRASSGSAEAPHPRTDHPAPKRRT